MTIEELLGCDADKLESFTTEQLNEWFSALLPTTRPEMVSREKESSVRNSSSNNKRKAMADQLEFNAKMELAKKLAAQHGIKL